MKSLPVISRIQTTPARFRSDPIIIRLRVSPDNALTCALSQRISSVIVHPKATRKLISLGRWHLVKGRYLRSTTKDVDRWQSSWLLLLWLWIRLSISGWILEPALSLIAHSRVLSPEPSFSARPYSAYMGDFFPFLSSLKWSISMEVIKWSISRIDSRMVNIVIISQSFCFRTSFVVWKYHPIGTVLKLSGAIASSQASSTLLTALRPLRILNFWVLPNQLTLSWGSSFLTSSACPRHWSQTTEF